MVPKEGDTITTAINNTIISNSTTSNPIIIDNNTCNIYKKWKHQVTSDEIKSHIGTYSVISFMIIIFFSCIRKRAWDYGRLAIVRHEYEAGGQHGSKSNKKDLLFGGVIKEAPPANPRNKKQAEEVEYPQEVYIDDSCLFQWIITTWRLSNAQIKAKSGPDAVHYLSFQRHLILIGSVIMVISVAIILPVNDLGNPDTTDNLTTIEFQMLSVKNAKEQGKLLWIHVTLTFLYLILTVAVLRHFSTSLQVGEDDSVMSRTVMISQIAKQNSHSEDKLRSHFLEIYPDIVIEEISFAYDISTLKKAESSWRAAKSARLFWEKDWEKKGVRPKLRPHFCGKLLCCCAVKKIDAIDYYRSVEVLFDGLVEAERKQSLSHPLGIAFITFQNVEMAQCVVTDYRFTVQCLHQRPHSYFSRKLKASQWVISYAPQPQDLHWENLSLSYKAWYFKAVIINVVLILLVVVYSTPVFIVDILNARMDLKTTLGVVAERLGLTMPSLLLMCMAVVLPSLVTFSDTLVGFWTKTAENRSVMVKTYTFLLFMVIILPALGSLSLVNYLTGGEIRYECIFDTSNSMFFVNYAITSSILGSVAELLRIPELLVYAIRLFFAKSSAEMDSIRKSVLIDFQFGIQYTWTMLNFTMFTVFSLISPMIAPFGFLYLVMKHFVDRYNIYFAYGPCQVDNEVHMTAINFAIVSMFMLQATLMAYIMITQDDTNRLLQVYAILIFCVSTAFFISQVFFNMCANFSAIASQKMDTVGQTEEVGPSGELSETTLLKSNAEELVRPTEHTRYQKFHPAYKLAGKLALSALAGLKTHQNYLILV
ncbi:unnamed protein product [Allacma fusca]|uniref:CSC1-like protein 2 n=1 Tax=Allacma fusca TaxID=39272 RepID=A0A8J2M8M6_9HEXA|nr:unnamed protein product [Allacma fusca]